MAAFADYTLDCGNTFYYNIYLSSMTLRLILNVKKYFKKRKEKNRFCPLDEKINRH